MQNHSPGEPWALATVLLVKHDVADATELAESLHEEPYQVYVVTSVAEALRVLAAQSVDVVLADQRLNRVTDGSSSDSSSNSSLRLFESCWQNGKTHGILDALRASVGRTGGSRNRAIMKSSQ